MSLAEAVVIEQVRWLYVVDYDIPTKNASRRVMFYEAIHHLFMMHLGKDVKFSTQSCYFTEDEELAKKFLKVVQEFNGKGHIYRATKLQ
ncbi:MAG: hypothetical protein ABSF09_03705 [Candidatus Bathyarchaeia archaeon]